MSIEKLNLLGIFEEQQLKDQDLDYWWSQKSNKIKLSEISKELKNEILITVNNAYDELKGEDLKTLRNYFSKVKKKKNKKTVTSKVNKSIEVDKDFQEFQEEYLKKNLNKVYQKVKSIVSKNLSVTIGSIKYNTNFVCDLGADSLGLYQMIMDFEEAFDIDIPDEDAEGIETVGDAVKYILENQLNKKKGWTWSNSSGLDKFAFGLLVARSLR